MGRKVCGKFSGYNICFGPAKVLKEYSSWINGSRCVLPNFEKVFAVCGGSMFLMDHFCEQYYLEEDSGMIKDLTTFSMVLQQQSKLTRALTPEKTFLENESPKWNKQQWIEVMKKIVHADLGILDYNSLCEEFGKKTINSMIAYNLLNFRPTSSLSFDIPSHRDPVITAESPAAFVAMKRLIYNLP